MESQSVGNLDTYGTQANTVVKLLTKDTQEIHKVSKLESIILQISLAKSTISFKITIDDEGIWFCYISEDNNTERLKFFPYGEHPDFLKQDPYNNLELEKLGFSEWRGKCQRCSEPSTSYCVSSYEDKFVCYKCKKEE